MASRPKPDAAGVEIFPADHAAHRCRLTLDIDGQSYAVRGVARDELPRLARRGFRIARTDPKGRRIAYVVTAGPLGLACTCKSVVYRSGPAAHGPDPICKHSRALAALGLLP